jgi:hypothetical protein
LQTTLGTASNHSEIFLLQIEYPNNLLRNTAKQGVASQYSLVVDIDMKPNKNLYTDFMNFARKNNLFDGGNSFYNGKMKVGLTVKMPADVLSSNL